MMNTNLVNELMLNINWYMISSKKLSNEFIDNFKDRLNWTKLSKGMTLDQIRKYKNLVNWDIISSRFDLTEEFIIEFESVLNFKKLTFCKMKLSEYFIERFKDKLDFNSLWTQKLSENMIEKFQDKIGWWNISRYQPMSEDFINKYIDKINFNQLFLNSEISESTIIKYINNNTRWDVISCRIGLSENFIRIFKDKVDWRLISQYQKLSKNFIIEFKHKIVVDNLKRNKYLTKKINTILEKNMNHIIISVDYFEENFCLRTMIIESRNLAEKLGIAYVKFNYENISIFVSPTCTSGAIDKAITNINKNNEITYLNKMDETSIII